MHVPVGGFEPPAYTGLRWGEAIGLRVKDVDFTLDIVAGRLDDRLAQTVVGKMWAEAARDEDEAR